MNSWRELARLPREIWILSGTLFVNRVGTMVHPFLLVYLTDYLRLDAPVAGFIAGMFGVGALLAGPLSGWISDWKGPLWPMVGSLYGAGLVMLIYPLISGLPALALMTIAMAMLAETYRPANLVLVSSLVEPERRKSAFSLIRLSVNLGMSIGPAMGGFLAGIWLPFLFFADGATSLAAGLVLVTSSLVRKPPAAAAARPAGQALDRSAFRDPHFVHFLLAILPAILAFSYFLSILPLFLIRELKQPEWVTGLMYTINTLLIVALQVPISAATNPWSSRRELSLGALFFALGFLLLSFSSEMVLAIAGLIGWTFGEMLLLPGILIYVIKAAPESRRGQYQGAQSLVFSISSIVGPWSGAIIQDTFGGHTLWTLALILSLVSAALLSRLPEPH